MADQLGQETILVVDDDDPFRLSLTRALQRRNLTVHAVGTIAEAMAVAEGTPLTYAAVDLRLGNSNGLDLVRILREIAPSTRIVLLTGYGNIASAVTAIKAGAADYLPKPVDVEHLLSVLRGEETRVEPAIEAEPMTPERVRWEHINRVFGECGHNVSETARRLRMHRRTLQRILSKHAPS